MTTQTSFNNEFADADLNITRSESAVTVSTTITNTDNTSAASRAYLKSTTGGASGGNPSVLFNVDGVTTYSIGVDNADSDAFKVSKSSALGTSDIMRCTTEGEWTYFDKPAFQASNDSFVNNITGNNNVYTPVSYTDEVFDLGSNYDNGTFIYTFPITGIYIISALVWSAGQAVNYCKIKLNSSNHDSVLTIYSNPTSDCGSTATAVFQADAADTVRVELTSGGGAGNADYYGLVDRSLFCGALIA